MSPLEEAVHDYLDGDTAAVAANRHGVEQHAVLHCAALERAFRIEERKRKS